MEFNTIYIYIYSFLISYCKYFAKNTGTSYCHLSKLNGEKIRFELAVSKYLH